VFGEMSDYSAASVSISLGGRPSMSCSLLRPCTAPLALIDPLNVSSQIISHLPLLVPKSLGDSLSPCQNVAPE